MHVTDHTNLPLLKAIEGTACSLGNVSLHVAVWSSVDAVSRMPIAKDVCTLLLCMRSSWDAQMSDLQLDPIIQAYLHLLLQAFFFQTEYRIDNMVGQIQTHRSKTVGAGASHISIHCL